MTGIGGLLFEPPKAGIPRWKRLYRWFLRRWLRYRLGPTRFVVLCFRRTGSNWLCGMLFNHPQILMHNEIFNENAVHTYYKEDVLRHNWDYEGRDVNPCGFLDFIYQPAKFSKFYNRPADCKAVGYKSFPNHYLQHAVPLASLHGVYEDLVLHNPDVKKIILMRQDVIRTYISSRRAFETGIYMTGFYQDHLVQVNIVDMQRFLDRYEETYETYLKSTRGHPRIIVTYEKLCEEGGIHETMQSIWRLLGVKPEAEAKSLEECKPQSSREAPLKESVANYDEVEFAYRHDVKLGKYFSSSSSIAQSAKPKSNNGHDNDHAVVQKLPNSSPCRWVLLVPIRSQSGDTVETCTARLALMAEALRRTARPPPHDPFLIFGVDDDDLIYRDGNVIRSVFDDWGLEVKILSGLQGRICKIWRRLAKSAYEQHDADFTCLLGDDVIIKDSGWQTAIEGQFRNIATKRRLPFGSACVAFVDESFRGFPTFPVVHKWHFKALGGTILPSQFDNQGGDPFLFELYKRFNASEFALDCCLENTIGGRDSARYTKQRLRYEDDILTTAVRQIQEFIVADNSVLVNVKPLHCLDVVVPVFRCDLAGLRKIIELRPSWPAMVTFWFVLDNPRHSNADAIRKLQTVSQNYQVNILEQFDSNGVPQNYGASAARNYGLAHSKADHVVLLDDDVDPSVDILDAYLGAIMRWPNASAFVGSTHLPEPVNLLTHAIVASDIPGAYTIAERVREPPWGVTANLCVRARTSRVRFDLSYPKTGGGEDLDYCSRVARHGPIKAVPGARAKHPWWSGGSLKAVGHILGWAEGEVKCIGKQALRQHVFFTLPNGVEIVLIMLTACIVLTGSGVWDVAITLRCLSACAVIIILEILWHASRIADHRLCSPMKDSKFNSAIVRALAAVLIMSQECTRFIRALSNSITWLFWRVDWHFGQNPHWVTASKRNNAARAVFYLFILYLFYGKAQDQIAVHRAVPHLMLGGHMSESTYRYCD